MSDDSVQQEAVEVESQSQQIYNPTYDIFLKFENNDDQNAESVSDSNSSRRNLNGSQENDENDPVHYSKFDPLLPPDFNCIAPFPSDYLYQLSRNRVRIIDCEGKYLSEFETTHNFVPERSIQQNLMSCVACQGRIFALSDNGVVEIVGSAVKVVFQPGSYQQKYFRLFAHNDQILYISKYNDVFDVLSGRMIQELQGQEYFSWADRTFQNPGCQLFQIENFKIINIFEQGCSAFCFCGNGFAVFESTKDIGTIINLITCQYVEVKGQGNVFRRNTIKDSLIVNRFGLTLRSDLLDGQWPGFTGVRDQYQDDFYQKQWQMKSYPVVQINNLIKTTESDEPIKIDSTQDNQDTQNVVDANDNSKIQCKDFNCIVPFSKQYLYQLGDCFARVIDSNGLILNTFKTNQNFTSYYYVTSTLFSCITCQGRIFALSRAGVVEIIGQQCNLIFSPNNYYSTYFRLFVHNDTPLYTNGDNIFDVTTGIQDEKITTGKQDGKITGDEYFSWLDMTLQNPGSRLYKYVNYERKQILDCGCSTFCFCGNGVAVFEGSYIIIINLLSQQVLILEGKDQYYGREVIQHSLVINRFGLTLPNEILDGWWENFTQLRDSYSDEFYNKQWGMKSHPLKEINRMLIKMNNIQLMCKEAMSGIKEFGNALNDEEYKMEQIVILFKRMFE